MKFALIKFSANKNRGEQQCIVNAASAHDALVNTYKAADGFGTWYETHTIRWLGTGFCREKQDWIAAECLDPIK